ncbi:MAG: hypothetical protein ACFB5Z_02160 [Elainellaceae cyanobacterium]
MHLGKVVKSNSHCDYVIQLDDNLSTLTPPDADQFGFGSFVKLEDSGDDLLRPASEWRHWAVGIIYNTQLYNPSFNSSGPRLSSEPDPLFTPDQVNEARTLLGVVLVGAMQQEGDRHYGLQRIPRVVVPFNTAAALMSADEIYRFHRDQANQPQFRYYMHLLRGGGHFATELAQHILDGLQASPFTLEERRALEVLRKELSWKTAMGAMR